MCVYVSVRVSVCACALSVREVDWGGWSLVLSLRGEERPGEWSVMHAANIKRLVVCVIC